MSPRDTGSSSRAMVSGTASSNQLRVCLTPIWISIAAGTMLMLFDTLIRLDEEVCLYTADCWLLRLIGTHRSSLFGGWSCARRRLNILIKTDLLLGLPTLRPNFFTLLLGTLDSLFRCEFLNDLHRSHSYSRHSESTCSMSSLSSTFDACRGFYVRSRINSCPAQLYFRSV